MDTLVKIAYIVDVYFPITQKFTLVFKFWGSEYDMQTYRQFFKTR